MDRGPLAALFCVVFFAALCAAMWKFNDDLQDHKTGREAHQRILQQIQAEPRIEGNKRIFHVPCTRDEILEYRDAFIERVDEWCQKHPQSIVIERRADASLKKKEAAFIAIVQVSD